MWAHGVLVGSHLVALPAIVSAYRLPEHAWFRLPTLFFVCVCVVASVGMHASDTKQGLAPARMWLRVHSRRLLAADRFCAMSAGAWFAFLLLLLEPSAVDIVWFARWDGVAAIGCVASLIGEATADVLIYVALHLVWHACAFGVMFATCEALSDGCAIWGGGGGSTMSAAP